jgi:hypothetical protein
MIDNEIILFYIILYIFYLNSNDRIRLVFFSSLFEFLQFLEAFKPIWIIQINSKGNSQRVLCNMGWLLVGPAQPGLAAHGEKQRRHGSTGRWRSTVVTQMLPTSRRRGPVGKATRGRWWGGEPVWGVRGGRGSLYNSLQGDDDLEKVAGGDSRDPGSRRSTVGSGSSEVPVGILGRW